ncbi:hypothetical protein PUMCH_004009 [Australozyma saopauloensis]|uniref:Uncharacterized protein n=1 Tax=Australozyma saopauloensis TaxID=291208 RepID=A0AAX4HDN1_9ASCO|nr:hypothetical protein PUMCH_004009 [[Candida] saopauloensis]
MFVPLSVLTGRKTTVGIVNEPFAKLVPFGVERILRVVPGICGSERDNVHLYLSWYWDRVAPLTDWRVSGSVLSSPGDLWQHNLWVAARPDDSWRHIPVLYEGHLACDRLSKTMLRTSVNCRTICRKRMSPDDEIRLTGMIMYHDRWFQLA